MTRRSKQFGAMEFTLQLVITVLFIAIATYILYMKWLRSKYPPGPWPLPIIGNLLQLSEAPHFDLVRLSKVYGPIFTVWMGRQPTVVLNNLELVRTGYIKKGIEFAGRAADSMGYRTVTYDNQTLIGQSYNKKVEVMRKLSLSIMKTQCIGGLSIQTIVEEELKDVIKKLKDLDGKIVDPHWIMYVTVSNTIMRSLFNLRFDSHEDESYLDWEKVTKSFGIALQKAVLVDLCPLLWYMSPNIRKLIRKGEQDHTRFVKKHLKYHEETYEEGTIRDLMDVVVKYQREGRGEVLTETNVIGLVGDMIGAGTSTTLSTILWCFLVLLYYPEVQQKIHQELDDFLDMHKERKECQNGSLAFINSDRPHLSYLNAFIHEMFRKWTVAPLGVPHKTLTDVFLDKYLIPKDTAVFLNIHACHMDSDVWDDPDEFKPERFLDENGDFDRLKAKQIMTFGGGARGCVGENLARIEVFLLMANVLSAFSISRPPDANLPSLSQVRYRVECGPLPYKMIFKLR